MKPYIGLYASCPVCERIEYRSVTPCNAYGGSAAIVSAHKAAYTHSSRCALHEAQWGRQFS